MLYAMGFFVVLLIGVHISSIVMAAIRLGKPTLHPLISDEATVSIIVPLKGLENFTEQTVARTFQLDWPDYEIIFCVAEHHDPVIPVVEKNMIAFPHIRASLLVGDDRISANPKLNNCVKGWRAAASNWVILADSNVLMPGNYISALMGAWQGDTGLVCSPPIGSHPSTIWAEVECSFLNSFQARYQYAAEALGNGFAQGKTMLWNKQFLDARGGIEALGTDIAEDAAATKLVRSCGLRVHLADAPFDQPLGYRTFKEIWLRQSRWARLRLVTFPHFFLPELFVGALPPFVIASILMMFTDLAPPACVVLLALILAAFYLPEIALVRYAGWRLSAINPFAMVLRDVLFPVIWLGSFTGSSVSWRGNPMLIDRRESRPTNPAAKTT